MVGAEEEGNMQRVYNFQVGWSGEASKKVVFEKHLEEVSVRAMYFSPV